MLQTDLHLCSLCSSGSLSLSLSLALSLFLSAHWYAWSSEASLNRLIVIFSCSGTDAFHFLSGLSVGVIKHLLQWHLTKRSWIDSTMARFSVGRGAGGIFYNIYIIYQISGKGCIVVLLQEKLLSIWVILTDSYCCYYSSPRGCSSKSMWESGRQVLPRHL